jgi:hypothetical protein
LDIVEEDWRHTIFHDIKAHELLGWLGYCDLCLVGSGSELLIGGLDCSLVDE